MELNFKGSFFRDLDNINNRYLLLAVKKKRDEITSAKSISQISHLKRFKVRSNAWHKIEITPEHSNKAYWILCTIRNDVVEFRRLKPEGYFKKKLLTALPDCYRSPEKYLRLILFVTNILKTNIMKSTKHSDELDVDFIQSRPLTEKEKQDLSAFIQKLKAKNKGKKFLKHKSRRRRLAA